MESNGDGGAPGDLVRRSAATDDGPDVEENGGGRRCGYSLCAALWPDDLLHYPGKGRKGGRPAEYHTDQRWTPEKVTCRDLGMAEQRDNRIRAVLASNPQFADRVGPAVHRPDLDTLADLLARTREHLTPAVAVLGAVTAHLDTVATGLDQDTQAALRRAEHAQIAEHQERRRREQAERDRVSAQAAAAEANRRATAAERTRDTALEQAQQATLERRDAQDLAATLAEQLDTARDNEQRATATLASRTAERDAAAARTTALEQELRDHTVRHQTELDTARGHYETTLAELRTEDRGAREQLHRDLKTGYDQQVHELTRQHDHALTQLRDQLDHARVTATEARAAARQAQTSAEHATTSATARAEQLTTLRDGVLAVLTSLPAELATTTLRHDLAALLQRNTTAPTEQPCTADGD